MNKRGIKPINTLKERGYKDEIISMWLEHIE